MRNQENRILEEELIFREDLVEIFRRPNTGETNLKTKKKKTNQDKEVLLFLGNMQNINLI